MLGSATRLLDNIEGVEAYPSITPPNGIEAEKWLRKASRAGLADAQFLRGILQEHGCDCIPISWPDAARSYRAAADQGHTAAAYHLGDCYWFGHGVEESQKLSLRWFNKAASQGHERARGSVMAAVYQNPELALEIPDCCKWMEKEAASNNYAAHVIAGVLLNGKRPPEPRSAFKWYLHAAQQNYHESQAAISKFYANGITVPQNFVEAYFWIILAIAGSGENFPKSWGQRREQLLTRLERDAITDAQQRASAWLNTHRAEQARREAPGHAQKRDLVQQVATVPALSQNRPSPQAAPTEGALLANPLPVKTPYAVAREGLVHVGQSNYTDALLNLLTLAENGNPAANFLFANKFFDLNEADPPPPEGMYLILHFLHASSEGEYQFANLQLGTDL